MSYYLLFSLFPLLLFVVALCAYLPLTQPLELFLDRVRSMVPPETMALFESRLRSLTSNERPQLLTLGLLGSFWSASRGVNTARRALNLAYGVQESRPPWKTELVSCSLTLAGGFLVLAATSALIVGGGVGLWIADTLGIKSTFLSAIPWLRWPVLAMTFMATAVLTYRFLSDVRLPFKLVAPGALAGALTWLLATWSFGRYVAAFGHYSITYGSLGGVMILVTWLYLTALITLTGAELNAVLKRV